MCRNDCEILYHGQGILVLTGPHDCTAFEARRVGADVSCMACTGRDKDAATGNRRNWFLRSFSSALTDSGSSPICDCCCLALGTLPFPLTSVQGLKCPPFAASLRLRHVHHPRISHISTQDSVTYYETTSSTSVSVGRCPLCLSCGRFRASDTALLHPGRSLTVFAPTRSIDRRICQNQIQNWRHNISETAGCGALGVLATAPAPSATAPSATPPANQTSIESKGSLSLLQEVERPRVDQTSRQARCGHA